MEPHPIDPVALVTGLFFGLVGLALLAESQWHGVDVAAVTAGGVMIIAVALLGLMVTRFRREPTEASTSDIGVNPTSEDPAPPR